MPFGRSRTGRSASEGMSSKDGRLFLFDSVELDTKSQPPGRSGRHRPTLTKPSLSKAT